MQHPLRSSKASETFERARTIAGALLMPAPQSVAHGTRRGQRARGRGEREVSRRWFRAAWGRIHLGETVSATFRAPDEELGGATSQACAPLFRFATNSSAPTWAIGSRPGWGSDPAWACFACRLPITCRQATKIRMRSMPYKPRARNYAPLPGLIDVVTDCARDSKDAKRSPPKADAFPSRSVGTRGMRRRHWRTSGTHERMSSERPQPV